MKILFVLTYYKPYWTGLTRYAARVAEGLAKRGHQVSVVCTQHDKALAKEELIEGVKVCRVPSISRISRSQLSPLFVFKAGQLIREADAIIVYFPLAEIILIALVAKTFRKKLFLVHNGDLVLPQGFVNRLLEKVFYLTTSWAIGLADKVIVLTEDYSEKSPLLSKFKNKWKVILAPCAIGNPSFKDKLEFRKKNKLINKKLIGFCGRFVEEKGADFLLEAIPRVVSEIPTAHFVFAGEYKISYENYWQKIQPLIKKYQKHITFLGLVEDRKKLGAFYSCLEVFVLPSRTDCFPVVQVEALLSGTPVVCADIPGARWVVKHTGMGLLAKPGNPRSLAEAIIKVMKNRSKYLRPRKEIEKIFAYEKSIGQFDRLVKN